MKRGLEHYGIAFLGISLSLGCVPVGDTFATKASNVVNLKPNACTTQLTGSSWVPNVPGVSASNHDPAITISKQVVTASGILTGRAQATFGREVSVTINVSSDLGAYGSLSLVTSVSGFPSGLQGGGYAALVSLSDGTNEFINLARANVAGDCAASGYYTYSSVLKDFVQNPGCTLSWPSAYTDWDHWEQHQVPFFDYSTLTTTSTFPTCNWAQGTNGVDACAFNSNFFSAGKLRTGTYTAKYVLFASDYSTLNGTYPVTLTVTAIKKTDTRVAPPVPNRAIDLNVILVGTKNIQASRTTKGQQNLDTLFSAVHSYYSQSSVGVKIGTINVYEWPCETGGDTYANPSTYSEIGTIFGMGSASVSAATEGKALNIFLVSTIGDTDPNYTILGLAGGIGGPMSNGTQSSGLMFSSFNKLDTFNPNCSGSGVCSLSNQEAAFVDMGATVAHEMGHYLGLNHPNESQGTARDVVYDTPICTKTHPVYGVLTNSSCATDTNVYGPSSQSCNVVCGGSYNPTGGSYCNNMPECQFNHMMWYTSKNFTEGAGTGDDNIFSTSSGMIIDYNPLIQ